MTLDKDFEDFTSSLNNFNVDYILLVITPFFSWKPRHTGDLDI